ncbi:MAG: DUF2092 domain-containing protein, partial [Microcystaceae cyanobacterium]
MMLARFVSRFPAILLSVVSGMSLMVVPPSLAQTPATPASARPALEPKAIEILKAMSDRLAKAKTLQFTAVTTYENPSRLGPALAYHTLSNVILQRPNKLQVLSPGDGPASEFYYNGKTLVA